MSRLVDSEGLLNRIPVPLEALNPFPNSPKRLAEPCPVLGCRCLHLFLTGAGWTFSEDNYAKILSGSITKYILSKIRDWCLPMGWTSIWAGYCLAIPSFWVPSFTCISCRQDKFCEERSLVQFVSLTLHWGSCLATVCGLFSEHVSLPFISAKIIPIDSLVPSHL